MVDGERVVNLKEENDLVKQYVELRNRHRKRLVTGPVQVAETREWLKRDDLEIRGIVRSGQLMGVVILYLSRNAEIAFFTRTGRLGLGSRLLSIIEKVAHGRGIREVWAWVLSDNIIAQRAFLKNGYRNVCSSAREHEGRILDGFIFSKTLPEVEHP